MQRLRSTRCCMCGTSEVDDYNLGQMKSLNDIHAHYFCLLLSNTITQSGMDEDGILGFTPEDISEEISRSKHRRCTYCGKAGASISCVTKGCNIQYHLPCGLQNHSASEFHGSFPSYCLAHRLRQRKKMVIKNTECPICYGNVDTQEWTEIVWAPCCKKYIFHKLCLQKMAVSAGYFFKCPICNNVEEFQKGAKRYGVFIPEQLKRGKEYLEASIRLNQKDTKYWTSDDLDASWELEPNAYEELLFRHDTCNATVCKCPKGRNHEGSGKFSLVLCHSCGSQGTHKVCSGLRSDDWACPDCVVVPKPVIPPKKIGTPGDAGAGCSSWVGNLRPRSKNNEDVIVISSEEETEEVQDETMYKMILEKNMKTEPNVINHSSQWFVISDVRSLSASTSGSTDLPKEDTVSTDSLRR